MKITLAILCLFAGWVRAAVPGTGLVADYNAALGVTESGGLVSQWNDQHQTLNADGLGPHNATQATGASKPTLVTDFQGNPGILFPWDLSPSHPNTFLTIPTSLTGMATRSLSVYAVMSHWHKDNPTAIFSLSSGQFMSLWSISSSPKRPAVWDQVAPTLYIPSNKSILATVGRASGSVVQWNDTRVTLSTVGSATGLSGGEIGREASSSSRWFSGIIYRLLIYNVPHTNAEVDAVVNALEAEHSVTMSYTNQIVCRGDSLTEGYGETALRSYPLQLNELLPTWKMYMYGSSGQQIGDSGTSNQMYNMDSAAIDPLFDGTMTRNVLAFMGGTNDINAGGLTGAQTFTRLTGYLTARKAAHAWETMVGTLPDRGTLDTQVGDYNTLIRTGDSTIDRIADYGKASSIETRLNLSTNATYFNADGVHLTNAGYGVIAEQNNARLFPMTIPAASASRADVGAAYLLCEDGDTLTIPVGTASWTSVLAVGKAITIQGAGIGQTIIQDDTSTNDVLLDVTLVADQTTRITGIEFEPGARATLALFGAINVVGANTDNRRIRIDHCKFDTLYRSAETINTVLGVFDHNTVIRRVTNGGGMGAIKGSTWDGATHGDGAMTAADDFGTDKFYFVEDCDFSSDTGAAYTLIDAQAGGRYVFRYNTVNNGSIESHGLEAAGERSGRAFEVYNNTFTGNNTRSTVGYYRGGVGLWHDNTISGFTTSCVVSLINNRSIEHLAFPFNGSDGRNVWDVNSGSNPFDTGTVTTGGAKTFTDTSKSWTPDDKWIGYTLRKTSAVPITSLTRSSTTITVTTTSPHGFSTGDEVSIFGANEWGFNYIYSNITVTGANTWTSTVPTSTGVPASGTGTMYCTKGVNFGEIVDSTANTVTVASGIFTANNMVLAAGETYEINKVTHSMDQPGRMGGTLLTGAYPALPGGWNNQTTSPWYEWNNLREGGADVDFSSLAAAGLTYAVVTAGTHYINDTVKPGYTPYTYPHPLVSGAADTTAPALAGCIVTVPGTTITLTFSEAVTRNSGTPTVSLSGGACSLSYSSGSGSSGHIYTLSRTVYAGETGTMSAAPGANGWEDAAGNDFAVVSNGPLTNNSTATPGGGSTAFGAGAGTASFGSGAGSVSFQ